MLTEITASIKNVVLTIGAVFLSAQVGYADPVTIDDPPNHNTVIITADGPTSFSFLASNTVTDVHIFIVNGRIGGGAGGPRFPQTIIPTPCIAAGSGGQSGSCIVFFGEPGIPDGGAFTISFIGFPVNTEFHISFSRTFVGPSGETITEYFEPIFLDEGKFSTEGTVRPVPEPATMLLLSTGLTGIAIKARKRFKSRKVRSVSGLKPGVNERGT